MLCLFHTVYFLRAFDISLYCLLCNFSNFYFYFLFFLQCSYERNYKILLDVMIKNDLALKGKFGGVELLILPSNQLPEKSKRKEL